MDYLNKQIRDSMKNELAEDATEILRDTKREVVYEAYTPYSTDRVTPHYNRTYQLLNSNETKMKNKNKLEITSPRGKDPDTGQDIASAVEEGNYTWGYTRNLNEEIGERPFMRETFEKLEDGEAVGSLKRALRKRLGDDAVQ